MLSPMEFKYLVETKELRCWTVKLNFVLLINNLHSKPLFLD